MATANANSAAQSPAPQVETFDHKELTRMMARLRHEVGGLVGDANRTRPFFTKTKEEAVAKRDAAILVLTDAAAKIDALKKQES